MERWFIAAKRADFDKIGAHFAISPVTARLMRNRDLTTLEEMERYLHGTLDDLYDPHLLKDAERAADILREKIGQGKKLRIVSDYDVDGVCANYILYRGLRRCGAQVDYKIPDRMEDGYGINEHIIERAHADGVDTIVTCDNGIAASTQIAYGNELGMTIVVTDHHDVPFRTEEDGSTTYELPPAAAVVNPKQADCAYPFSNICGAVVAYKFMQVLYEKCGISPAETEEFLEVAALATVCDVMPLVDENRILVREGLSRMQHTKITGLRALIEANGLSEKTLSSYHLGFVIGPCINASGRLSSAKEALELFLCEDAALAARKAEQLVALNAERKQMTADGVEAARQYLEESGHSEDKVLVAYLPDCHESIAGIIAGRIREIYNKPIFVITRTKEGLKGSGRSIETYHMFREMTKIKECFEKYGGHPMAAGLSMKTEMLEPFREKLNENATLTEEDFVRKVHIDVALPVSKLSEELIEEFSLLEPFGNGNEKPLFAQKSLSIQGVRMLGTTGHCLKLFLADATGRSVEAMYFGESALFLEELAAFCGEAEAERVRRGLSHSVHMHVTYYPQINEWRGRKTLQIVLKNYRFTR